MKITPQNLEEVLDAGHLFFRKRLGDQYFHWRVKRDGKTRANGAVPVRCANHRFKIIAADFRDGQLDPSRFSFNSNPFA